MAQAIVKAWFLWRAITMPSMANLSAWVRVSLVVSDRRQIGSEHDCWVAPSAWMVVGAAYYIIEALGFLHSLPCLSEFPEALLCNAHHGTQMDLCHRFQFGHLSSCVTEKIHVSARTMSAPSLYRH
jgi:hypothetical protein